MQVLKEVKCQSSHTHQMMKAMQPEQTSLSLLVDLLDIWVADTFMLDKASLMSSLTLVQLLVVLSVYQEFLQTDMI